ncbi:MAG: universal stress protein [Melioribacter sp.]|uniref:universal stress protein n=1 Tax=Rosettibacter primus TaxID=3111523 RepID=UPI00247B50FA|nr:universal stress protein [Melioribacter sp.]
MFNIKNIIVPTDFSNLSYSAFDYARDLAEQINAKIHLIYVLEKTPPFLALRSVDVSEEEIMKDMEEEAKKQLSEAAKKLRYDSNVEIIEVCRKGIDYEEIVKYSKEVEKALIVIATHGRTGILHTLLGSVAEKVIRYAKCPVLVITPEEEQIDN